MIRNAAAQDIVAFLGILEPKNWPECLTLLVNQLDDQDTLHQEVCHCLLFYSVVFFGCGWSSVAVALPTRHLVPQLCQNIELEIPPLDYFEASESTFRARYTRSLPKNCHYRSSGGWIFKNHHLLSDRETNSLQSVLLRFPVYSTA